MREAQDEQWFSEKQDVGEGERGIMYSSLEQVLNSRKRTDTFTSEGGSAWASSLPPASVPSPPLVLFPFLSALHLSLALFLSSSLFPSFSLFTVVSPCLSPFLSIFLHLSLSYPQSSRLSIAPLRSPWSKYFTGIEIDPELSIFKWSKVLELRTAKGGRNGPA